MSPEQDWRNELKELLPLYGHRNWLVVADSAFPAQVGAVEVIATGEDHVRTVREVIDAVQAAAHVRPVIWLDVELNALTEDLAPGVEATRSALTEALRDLPATSMLHADLLERLSMVAETYQILVLKTTGVVPYSSVFIELDCGYWSSRNEARLRQVMEQVSVA
jgi:L-fucose mutarotase/ribose pyranase (RbsD/FucU family)